MNLLGEELLCKIITDTKMIINKLYPSTLFATDSRLCASLFLKFQLPLQQNICTTEFLLITCTVQKQYSGPNCVRLETQINRLIFQWQWGDNIENVLLCLVNGLYSLIKCIYLFYNPDLNFGCCVSFSLSLSLLL